MVRQNAIYALLDDESSRDLIIKTAWDEDENIAFQDVRALNMADPSEARKIADEYLNKGVDGAKLRIAIKVKAHEFAQSPKDTESINKFISFCKERYFESSDQLLRDTIVFSLSDLFNKDALEFIINEDSVSTETKIYCVDQNYLVLINMLQDQPTAENIEFAKICTDIYPIKEIVNLINDAIINTDGAKTIVLAKYSEVYPANTSWDELYYCGRS